MAMTEEQRAQLATEANECIRCGEKIEEGLARYGASECHDCKEPSGATARPGANGR